MLGRPTVLQQDEVGLFVATKASRDQLCATFDQRLHDTQTLQTRLDEIMQRQGLLTCDSYRHMARSAQRRMSVSRLRAKDGELAATQSRGAVGRVESRRASPLITKIMRDYLPTDATMKLWSRRERGSWACVLVVKRSSGMNVPRSAGYNDACLNEVTTRDGGTQEMVCCCAL